ncbi:MAG: tetraacyldisaccharide 4'-kinase [Phycisphaera sp.]|nr:tetraacyldisaccharide 4'-kinase [Phycisphaera sp.]
MESEIPPRWATPLLLPFVPAYAAAVAWRNRRYDRLQGVARLDPAVISVGNLVMGGTGKTPVCRWLVEAVQSSGMRAGIAMRGYRASETGVSDEAAEYAMEMPDVPLAIGPDRVASIRALDPMPDCIVLDDGFQHRRVHRDLDVVLVDASRTGLDRPMLPAGPRRESLGALRRADAVIITRASGTDPSLSDTIAKHHGRPPIAWTTHRWTGLVEHRGDRRVVLDVEAVAGRPLFGVFGIGNPGAIRQAVLDAGGDLRGCRILRDHAAYTPAMISDLVVKARAAGADAIFTTAKDWVKWVPHSDRLDGMPVLVPKLRINFLEGEPAFRAMLGEALRLGG